MKSNIRPYCWKGWLPPLITATTITKISLWMENTSREASREKSPWMTPMVLLFWTVPSIPPVGYRLSTFRQASTNFVLMPYIWHPTMKIRKYQSKSRLTSPAVPLTRWTVKSTLTAYCSQLRKHNTSWTIWRYPPSEKAKTRNGWPSNPTFSKVA